MGQTTFQQANIEVDYELKYTKLIIHTSAEIRDSRPSPIGLSPISKGVEKVLAEVQWMFIDAESVVSGSPISELAAEYSILPA